MGFDKQTVITGDVARGQRLTISVGADGARREIVLGVGHGTDYGDAAATGIKQVISRGGGPFAIANHYVRRVDAEQTFTQQHERVIAIQAAISSTVIIRGLKMSPSALCVPIDAMLSSSRARLLVVDSTMTP